MDQLRAKQWVEQIYATALAAVDATHLVKATLQLTDDALWVQGERYPLIPSARLVVLAIGKASLAMARGAEAALGKRITHGLVVTKRGLVEEIGSLAHFRILEAEHPVPGPGSFAAGEAVLSAVSGLRGEDLVVVLLSGGGSALVESLHPPLTREELAVTTELLLRAGADIWLLNAVRRRLSRIKAGGLARAALPARVINIIVSDVLGNPLPVIASGPTVSPEPEDSDPIAQIRALGVWEHLPPAVQHALLRPIPAEPLPNVLASIILADARTFALAAQRAIEQIGLPAHLLADRFTGEAREFARFWAALARHIHDYQSPWNSPVCLIGAGELTVTVRGQGRGGRNTEMALAAALELAGLSNIVIASLASDGDDGLSGAAGAVVTGETVTALRAHGIDPHRVLWNNDSATALEQVEGLLPKRVTNTNVNDLYLALIGTPPADL